MTMRPLFSVRIRRSGERAFAPAATPAAARGFSLVEVLAALAIFAMAFIVILSTYANILNSYEGIRRSRDADEDVKFARAALLAEPDIQKAQDGDEFDSTDDRHVRWSSTIEPSDTIADLFSVAFECEITTAGQNNSEPEKVTETFMVLRPTWSDPIERGKLLQATKDQIAELQGKLPNGFVAGSPPPANAGGFGGGGGGGGRGGRGGPGGGGRGGRGGPGGPGGPGGGNGNFGNGGGRGANNGNGNGNGGGGRFGNGGNGNGNGNFPRGGSNGAGGRGAGGGGGGGGGQFRGGGGANGPVGGGR
jgi:prepilin-type N-terminal cleavage/methylation domain-containing protein